MDSAKIFALGLAAGLAIHVLMRNRGKQAEKGTAAKQTSTAGKSSSKKTKGKKKKDNTSAVSAAVETRPKSEPVKQASPPPAVEEVPVTPAAQTTSQKKKNKKSKQSQPSQPSQPSNGNESYAAVAETAPAPLNNETLRAKADAAQTAFTASLGDMRDAEVDPLPAGYSSVARIPAAEVEAPKPKLSKKEIDDGWSSVGGTFSSAAAKSSGSTPAVNMNGVAKASIASNNPFAALPDDATSSSVRRIPAKPKSNGTSNGWTVASSTSLKSKPTAVNGIGSAETKKQRSNANKTQAKKAAKEEADRLQAERLANHRRQQANEAAKQREVAARPQPKSVPGSSKVNGAKASVDLNGRLVWD